MTRLSREDLIRENERLRLEIAELHKRLLEATAYARPWQRDSTSRPGFPWADGHPTYVCGTSTPMRRGDAVVLQPWNVLGRAELCHAKA